MELTQLRYFVEVARCEHITQAARRLYTSQSSLSKTIARLEQELGTPLFDRIGNRIKLNDAGKIFLQGTSMALRQLDESVQAVKAPQTTIRMASSLPGLLPDLMERYLVEHPDTRFRQWLLPMDEMRQQLEQCEIDLAVTQEPIVGDYIQWQELYRDEIIIVVSRQHPLASQSSVSLSQLQNERFLCNNAGFGTRNLIEKLCAKAGFMPNIILECHEPELLYKITSGNQAVYIGSELNYLWKALALVPDPPFQFMKALRITDPDPTIPIGVGKLRDRQLLPAVQGFYDLMLETYQSLQAVKDRGDPITAKELMQSWKLSRGWYPTEPPNSAVME